jgi:molybdate transport system regulatory protein
MEESEHAKKWARIRLNYNFWMTTDDGQTAISDERLQLLIAIQDYGTLREASKVLGVSYRKAWGDLKDTEKLLGLPLIEKHRGGKEGGSTKLTADGRVLVDAYKTFRIEFQDSVSLIIRKFKRTLKDN